MRILLFALMMMLSLPGFAWADDYLCEETRSLEQFERQRWFPEEFPIKVYIPPVPFATAHPEMYVPLVREAFATWERPFKLLRFTFVDKPELASIQIQWQQTFELPHVWGLTAMPILHRDRKLGVQRHASMIFLAVNAQPGTGMSVFKPVPFSYIELLAIAKHEVGHALGLRHSKGDGDLMGPHAYGFLSNSIFPASPRDIQTLLRLYGLPRKLKQHPCQ